MKNFFVVCSLLITFSLCAGFTDTSEAAAPKNQVKPASTKPVSADKKDTKSLQQKSAANSNPSDARLLDELTESFSKRAELSPATAPEGASIPPARIEEAELAFMRAWRHYIMRNYWQALNNLDQAHKANIFLVDVYYLRGLILRKIGEFSLANKSILSFLEVRTRDVAAINVLKGISESKSELDYLVSESSYPLKWKVVLTPIYESLNTGYLRPFLSRGLGKLSGFGTDLCFPDTISNSVFYRTKRDSGRFLTAEGINSPIKALLPGDGEIYVINFDGEIYQMTNNASFDLKSRIECDSVSDACYISASEIAVADPVGRRIAFYSFPEYKFDDEWKPDESHRGDYLFEPVAVKAYANWLAAADRANGRIYFIDLRNKRSFFVENKNVRDIIWSSLGILLSINENSEISAYFVDFSKKTADEEILRSDLKNAWAFFQYKGEIFCSDITGESIWKITPTPNPNLDISPAFLSLYDPQYAIDEQDNAILSVYATFSSPFSAWKKEILPTVTSIWNEHIIKTSVTKLKALPAIGLCFSRGNVDGMVSSKMRVVPVESCAEIYSRLPLIWSNQRDLITNFIIDSLIVYSHEELLRLTAFCLFNGIRIDIWARGIPPVELMRASAATGGEVYFSIVNEPMLTSLQNGLKLQLLLPFKTEVSGYPDRSTMSTYLSFRQLLGRDWIPIWIDALGK
jgi:tetratricopeptide (TPR) repeat protein